MKTVSPDEAASMAAWIEDTEDSQDVPSCASSPWVVTKVFAAKANSVEQENKKNKALRFILKKL
jgi:hypothetical protein